MNPLLIAVALDEKGEIGSHAGRAKDWQVYAYENESLVLLWDIQLTDSGMLHEFHVSDDGRRHPLHAVDVAIASSAGEGVTRRLQERGTRLLTTTESYPIKAIEAFLIDALPDGLPHEESECHDPAKREARKA